MQTENQSTKPETELKQETGEGCPEATCSACLSGEDVDWKTHNPLCPEYRAGKNYQHENDRQKRKRSESFAAAIGAGYCSHLSFKPNDQVVARRNGAPPSE
jgi:hypothetical protein